MRSVFLSMVIVASAAAAACYTGAGVGNDAPTDPNASGNATNVNGTAPATGDLPCDVSAIVVDNCSSCHGEPLAGGAPNRLLTHDDFAAPSKSDPTQSEAQLALARMKDAARPMPPTGLLAGNLVAAFEAWVNAGLPTGTCSAGATGSSGANTAAVCTSNQMWTRGNRGSSSMHPGVACIACHASGGGEDGPRSGVAGTVYATAHEPDDCYGGAGAAAGVTVVITDANGTVYNLTPNAAGNFYNSRISAMPYTAKVVSASGKIRAMASKQTNGDCNSCHTQNGAQSAPGRIFAP